MVTGCESHAECAPLGEYCQAGECAPPSGTAHGSGRVDLPIPDDDPAGVEAIIPFWERGMVVTQALVQVELDHERPGDLVVDLLSPEGERVRLRNQTPGGQVSGVYDLERAPDGPGTLDDLVGTSANGEWRLFARDLSPGVEGTLGSFAIFLDLDRP